MEVSKRNAGCHLFLAMWGQFSGCLPHLRFPFCCTYRRKVTNRKKFCTFPDLSCGQGGYVMEFCAVMCEVWDFWKCFCFPAMDAVLSGFPILSLFMSEYGLGIWALETMRKRPRASQRPWPCNL